MPVMIEWTDAEALHRAIITELQTAIQAAAAALAELEELPRFSWPRPSTALHVPMVVRVVELAESFARASSNHVNRVVVALAISGPESARPHMAQAVYTMVQSTGTPDLKWMLFGRVAALGERIVRHRRQQPCPTDRVAASETFAEFCQDASARVLTVKGTQILEN